MLYAVVNTLCATNTQSRRRYRPVNMTIERQRMATTANAPMKYSTGGRSLYQPRATEITPVIVQAEENAKTAQTTA